MTNLSLACNQSWLFKIAGELSHLLEVSCSFCSLMDLKRFLAFLFLILVFFAEDLISFEPWSSVPDRKRRSERSVDFRGILAVVWPLLSVLIA